LSNRLTNSCPQGLEEGMLMTRSTN